MNQVTETILVGFSVDHKKDIPVLIVGKKRKNQSMEVINAFQGDEAKELWNKLVVKKDI